ncbi:MAG: hypothetical protein ABIJ95_12910 [Pseudomonadota bacterium]
MSGYDKEQAGAHGLVLDFLSQAGEEEVRELSHLAAPYLAFRREVDAFLSRHFSGICTRACYENERSACCSRDGILTWFADHVVNVLAGGRGNAEALAARLAEPGHRCVYLGPGGCSWAVRPLVCALFLCGRAREEVFALAPALADEWEALRKREKEFIWPDRPVLFETLEARFLARGLDHSLMHCHKSPGLRMVRKKAGRE